MMLRIWGAAALAACMLMGVSSHAMGGNVLAARKQIESSLQVSGTITIAPDGSVQAHTVDPAAPLGEQLTRFLDERIRSWRFEPVQVQGRTVTANVPMHLRLVAKPAGDGKLSVSIASTYFGSHDAGSATDHPRSTRMTPPQFPADAMDMGGKGTVYLIVQVARDGTVANVGAEQVNLRVLGNARQMDVLRKSFTAAALRAARGWTFEAPTTGESAKEEAWLVRVPVDFILVEQGEKKSLERTGWDTYVPGPRNREMPWAQETLRTAANPDALPNDGIYPLREGAKLLSPPAS